MSLSIPNEEGRIFSASHRGIFCGEKHRLTGEGLVDILLKNTCSFAEMEKGGDTGDISLLFFLAGANFWAILGNFRAILAILGHF